MSREGIIMNNDTTKYRLLDSNYRGKSMEELLVIYEDKRKRYNDMMEVMNPEIIGKNFLDDPTVPVWMKLAHLDEFLDCPHCQED
jgi:predicted RNA methylase